MFKLCNPAEGEDILRCQAEALEHIALADPELPIPRLRRTRDGKSLGLLEHEGVIYPVMLLSWLDGDVLGEKRLTPDALFAFGRLLARLGIAMRGFVSGAPAGRSLVWDTRHATRLAAQLQHLSEDDRGLAQEILAHHEHVTVPAMLRMRSQIIHGDVHPNNVLVGPDGQVNGIIDFGDLVHAPLVQDLANSVAEFLDPAADVEQTIFEMVRGYRSLTALEEIEADALIDLIETRLVMTPLVDAMKSSDGIAPQAYMQATSERSMPMVRALRKIGTQKLSNLIRRAAAFPAKPPHPPQDSRGGHRPPPPHHGREALCLLRSAPSHREGRGRVA